METNCYQFVIRDVNLIIKVGLIDACLVLSIFIDIQKISWTKVIQTIQIDLSYLKIKSNFFHRTMTQIILKLFSLTRVA